MADLRSLNPTCEDYHSDDSEDVPESFCRSPASSGQANVAAKRSHPSDLGTEKPIVANFDLQSDSGYSSHTAATMSSADSAPSAKSQSPPAAVVDAAPPPSPSIRRRPTISDDRRIPSSPRKPLQRSPSISTRRHKERAPAKECTDPTCTKCGPNPNARGRRLEPSPLSPLDSGLDVSYSYDQRSQQSDPTPSYPPTSPTYIRQPSYMQGSAMIQPSQTRRRGSSQSGARPVSYHGDVGQGYWVSGMPFPTPPQDHGPPPSISAHFNIPQLPQQMPPQMGFGMMNATPPNNYYPPGHPMHTTPPYEGQRPQMQSRTSSQFSTRRPTSQNGTAVVTYDQNNQTGGSMPSARYPNVPQSARTERFPRPLFGSESSEEESEEEEDLDRALMPPPRTKGHTQRPSLSHRNTTQVVYPSERMTQSVTIPERPRVSRVSTAAPSRSSSTTHRPPLVQQTKSRSYETADNAHIFVEPSRSRPRPAPGRPSNVAHRHSYVQPEALSSKVADNADIFVESSRSRRRQSYMGHEKEHELKAKHRDSKIYEDNDGTQSIALSGHRRQKTNLDSRQRERIIEAKGRLSAREIEAHQRRREENITDARARNAARENEPYQRRRGDTIVEAKARNAITEAEAYQQRMRGTDIPLTEQALKASRRTSRVPSGPSETDSHSDKASRISQSNRTVVTNGGGNGEIRLRVDTTAPLSLQFNGDMEGRTISLNPAEGGMADIVIGASRGTESVYRSEKGSAVGSRKALMASDARREAEESSVKSRRSSRSGRDGEWRPLRRRREFDDEY